MPRKVINWLRKKIEPVMGEGIMRVIEQLEKRGVDPSVIRTITDKTLQYTPEITKKVVGFARDKSMPLLNEAVGRAMDVLPKKYVEMYAPSILDAIPNSVNPTFDTYPQAPPPKQQVSARIKSRVPMIPAESSPAVSAGLPTSNTYKGKPAKQKSVKSGKAKTKANKSKAKSLKTKKPKNKSVM